MTPLQQSQYKRMKKQVIEETAIGVGYFEGITSVIPFYAMIKAIRELSRSYLVDKLNDAEVQNILVTESIKALNYQDFKEVAPYLFSYPREARQEDLLVKPVEISKAYFEELQAKAKELFQIKAEADRPKNLEEMIEFVETVPIRVPSGYDIVGVNPVTNDYMISYKDDEGNQQTYLSEGFLEHDYLINDYTSYLSDEAQIVNHLITNYPSTESTIYEYFNDLYYETTGNLDGLELVERYFEDEGRSIGINLTSTADLYYLAHESEQFKQDYPDYKSFLLETVDHNYMFDNAYQLLESEDYLASINRMLNKEGQHLTIERVKGYSQGNAWVLGAVHPLSEVSEDEVRDFLVHGAGAAYKGSLIEVFVSEGNAITQLGLETAKAESSEQFVIDEALLYGDDALENLQEKLGLRDFVTVREAEELLEQTKTKESLDEDMEKGRSL
ncbi:UNVERIFIED_CONTAM: hypothetical protein KB574_00030 [Streptococcus canis]